MPRRKTGRRYGPRLRNGKNPFAYFELGFDKLMHDPAPEELPEHLAVAWLRAQGEPAMADDTAVA